MLTYIMFYGAIRACSADSLLYVIWQKKQQQHSCKETTTLLNGMLFWHSRNLLLCWMPVRFWNVPGIILPADSWSTFYKMSEKFVSNSTHIFFLFFRAQFAIYFCFASLYICQDLCRSRFCFWKCWSRVMGFHQMVFFLRVLNRRVILHSWKAIFMFKIVMAITCLVDPRSCFSCSCFSCFAATC